MAQPFIGEIRMFAGNFAPAGWMFCEGQLLSITEYDTLFNLIGTTFGGDGQNTFALPDLRGRVPFHMGNEFFIGQQGGAESVTLTQSQIPSHQHEALVSSRYGSTNSPDGAVLARSSLSQFAEVGSTHSNGMGNSSSLGSVGGYQPHNNMQPYLAVNYIISIYGIYPSPGSSGDSSAMGEVRWVAFNFAPKGWEMCNGQMMDINANQALFSLLGTTYGGDGRVNFGLPNLRGKVAIHQGQGKFMGQVGGEQAHTLTLYEMPSHSHSLTASGNPATSSQGKDNIFGVTSTSSYTFAPDSAIANVMTSVGGSQPHNNMQPYLCLNAIIATTGVFPTPDGSGPPNPFVAEIRMVAFQFIPRGWALCNGPLLPLSQNTALFSLLGTTYGGNGSSTFGLPNMEGTVAIGAGQGIGLSDYRLGQVGGEENVTLLSSDMPAHNHSLQYGTAAGSQEASNGNIWNGLPNKRSKAAYTSAGANPVTMGVPAINPSGGNQPHNNMQPYLTLNFLIATQGVFPSRS